LGVETGSISDIDNRKFIIRGKKKTKKRGGV